MYWNRLRAAAFAASLLLVAACENPSNVGADLVGASGGEPVVDTVAVQELRTVTIPGTTGNAGRVLVGQVDDAIVGAVEARGYLDFTLGRSTSTKFRTGPTTKAQLRLINTYVFGDTTASVVLRVREMPAAWKVGSGHADTTLEAGAVVVERTVSVADTLIVIDLPESWVAAHDTTLHSTYFASVFHGFQIEAVGGNTIVGFDEEDSVFRVHSGTDSTDYVTSQQLTTLQRSRQPQLAPDRLLLQDGPGSTIRFQFNLDPARYGSSAVNRLTLYLPVDTLALEQNTPAHYVRPRLSSVTLVGVTDDSLYVNLGSFNVSSGRFSLSSYTLNNAIQAQITGDGIIDHFMLIPGAVAFSKGKALPSTVNSLNAILLKTGADGPVTVLTTTPVV